MITVEAAIGTPKDSSYPIVYLRLKMKPFSREHLGLCYIRYRYDNSVKILTIKESKREDIPEEWDLMKKSDGTYETIAILDTLYFRTPQEVISNFDLVGISGSVNIEGLSFQPIRISRIPEFLEKYCGLVGFMDYDS